MTLLANGLFGGGNGTELSPYLIEDTQDFMAIRNFENHLGVLAFKQMVNLDFAFVEGLHSIDLPLVDLIYDGNGKSNFNMIYDISDNDACIFYTVSSIVLKNITFNKCRFISPYSTGLIGYIEDVTDKSHTFSNVKVLNCSFNARYNSASILIAVNRADGTGYINFDRCYIDKCLFNGNYIGCLCVFAYAKNVKVSKCYVNNSKLSVSNEGYSYFTIFIYGTDHNSREINVAFSDCYAKGNTLDTTNLIYDLSFGGFIGQYGNRFSGGSTYITIENCYFENDLKITLGNSNSYVYFGGFAGGFNSLVKGGLNIKNSFLLGTINIGGLQQINNGEIGDILPDIESGKFYINSVNVTRSETFQLPLNEPYYSELDNQLPNTINVNAQTVKETYSILGWDFKDIWDIKEGLSTPFFKLKRAIIKCKRVPLTNYRR